MPYWRLHYHLIWATYKRLPLLTEANHKLLYGTLYGKADELRAIIHALGNVEDHIHVVVSIPPKIAIADCVKHFKGASSREVTRVLGQDFQWQAGYGALSLGGRSLPNVMAYANHQAQHHSAGTTISVYERISQDDDGPVLQPPM